MASKTPPTSARGISLLKTLELGPGGVFAARPYHGRADKPGVLTIGYGHVILPGEKFELPLTEIQATNLMIADVHVAELFVDSVAARLKLPLTQDQYDACVLLAFNIGGPAFCDATLVKRLVAGERGDTVAREWMRWVYANRQRQDGQVIRRTLELMLFQGASDEAIAAEHQRLSALAVKGSL
jgi:lysozyme